MAKRSTPTSDALEILRRRVHEGMPRRFKKLEGARANEEIARKIQQLRIAAILTQGSLASLPAPSRWSSAAWRTRTAKVILW